MSVGADIVARKLVGSEVYMKLYVVSADTCKCWGAHIYIFAICDSMEKALEEQKKVRGFSQITEVEMNKFKPVYLGGYEE